MTRFAAGEFLAMVRAGRIDPDRVTVVTDDGQVVSGRAPHWASCPKAEAFKRLGRKRSTRAGKE